MIELQFNGMTPEEDLVFCVKFIWVTCRTAGRETGNCSRNIRVSRLPSGLRLTRLHIHGKSTRLVISLLQSKHDEFDDK